MRTVFATLPENPNIRVKLTLSPDEGVDRMFNQHFANIDNPIRVEQNDVANLETIRAKMMDSGIWGSYGDGYIDLILANIIIDNIEEGAPLNFDNILPLKRGKEEVAEEGCDDESSPSTPPRKGIEEEKVVVVDEDYNIDVIKTLIIEWVEKRRNVYYNKGVSVTKVRLRNHGISNADIVNAYVDFENNVTKQSGKIYDDWSEAMKQAETKLDELHFIEELENNLEQVLRRALQPLYHFIGMLSVALSDTDVRRLYKFKNKGGVTLEELQNPIVNRGENKTFKEFFDNNKHLSNTLILYTVSIMRNLPKKEEPVNALIGHNFGSSNPIAGNVNDFRNWIQYAEDTTVYPSSDDEFDISKWYACALPYEAYTHGLSEQVVAAFNWAVSDIWRFTNRRDFTVPLLIKSPDTRDIFALMVRNKYMITTGSVYSDSITVGSNGSTSKRYMTAPGYRARDRRASENLAGKHWFSDVILVNKKGRMHVMEIIERAKYKIFTLWKLRTPIGIDYATFMESNEVIALLAEYNDNNDVEWSIRYYMQAVSGNNVTVDNALKRTKLVVKCYDLMNQELKYMGNI